MTSKEHDQLLRVVRERILRDDEEHAHYGHCHSGVVGLGPVDYFFTTPAVAHDPHTAFDRLRWGGQMVFAAPDADQAEAALAPFRDSPEFAVEQEVTRYENGSFIGLSRWYHWFAVRKTSLIRSDAFTDRFTYSVKLIRDPADPSSWVVYKHVPRTAQMVNRLHERFPEMPMPEVQKRARSFTKKIFPLFLTREVGMLKVLKRHLPETHRDRVPRALDVTKNDMGFVVGFTMNWMRNGTGGKPLGHVEFATQAIDLLRQVHDKARVLHMDLRPDNTVITENGVGFIDFGSSVRIDEDVNDNKMLRKMFDQVLNASGVQKVLRQMCRSGAVTSSAIRSGYGRLDKAADLFYLMLQMKRPLSNPDFCGLVSYEKGNGEERMLSGLARVLLKPDDPDHPVLQSAEDVYRALRKLAA